MEIEFTHTAKKHLEEFKKAGDRIAMKKIEQLLQSIIETLYSGIGKPEELKFNWAGFWSRRITEEHRLIYSVENKKIIVYALKGHYM